MADVKPIQKNKEEEISSVKCKSDKDNSGISVLDILTLSIVPKVIEKLNIVSSRTASLIIHFYFVIQVLVGCLFIKYLTFIDVLEIFNELIGCPKEKEEILVECLRVSLTSRLIISTAIIFTIMGVANIPFIKYIPKAVDQSFFTVKFILFIALFVA